MRRHTLGFDFVFTFLWGNSTIRGNRSASIEAMSAPCRVAEPEADGLSGFTKRSRGRDGPSHEAPSCAEFEAMAEELQQLRVQNVELKARQLPPQMATSPEGVVGTVQRLLAPGGTKPVKVWTSKGADGRGAASHKSMPALNVSLVGRVALVAFFTQLPAQLLHAGVPADRPAAAAACALVRTKLASGAAAAVTASAVASIEAMGSAAATTYGDPSPLHSLLTPTSAIIFVTTWRPYLDGMTAVAEAVDVDSPNTVGLTLQCLATYLKPDRLSLTGAMIGASILEYTRGLAINAMAFDMQAFYSVEAGSSCGTGDVQPDPILNAENMLACADFFFTLIFFNSMRKVLLIDGDVNKVSLNPRATALAFMPAPHSRLSLSLSPFHRTLSSASDCFLCMARARARAQGHRDPGHRTCRTRAQLHRRHLRG